MPNKTIKLGKKQFYNVEALSKMLFIPVDTVRKYIREGKIKSIKVGKRYLVSVENLDKFLSGEDNKWYAKKDNNEVKFKNSKKILPFYKWELKKAW